MQAGGNVTAVAGDYYEAAPDPLAQYFQQLPPAPGDFVGREAEQQDLLNMIERGAVITGLRGLGGIGKTALGLVIAHQLKARYPDAQFFLDLRGAGDNPVTPLEALTHVVRAYYPTSKLPDSLEEMQKLYRSELQGKRALVFFDNAKDAQQVMPLLPPASCLLLITSREHFALPGLKARDLNVLPPDKARELVLSIADRLNGVFASRAAAKQSPASNEIAAPPAAARNDGVLMADLIAQLCGYLPQALRASASLLAETIDRDPVEYARQLRDERQRLHNIGLDPARNLDMEASLNLSYAALSAEAQRVLARLSVFPAGFDAAAEEMICEDEEHAHLSRLVKLSLVQYNPHPSPLPEREREDTTPLSPTGRGVAAGPALFAGVGEGRYSLHDLVRLFAGGHLSDEERAAAQHRHAEHYKNVLSAADDLYLQGNEFITQGLALFDREWVNVQAGQQWAAEHTAQDKAAAQLCDDYPNAGIYTLQLRLHPREQIRWIEQALSASRILKNREREGIHLGNLGSAYYSLGETRKAIEYHEQSAKVAHDIGNKRGEGAALGNLGSAYYSLGETRKAIEFYEQQRLITQEIGDRRGEGNALWNMALALDKLGEREQAVARAEAALKIYEAIESPHAEKVSRQLAEWKGA